MVESEVLINFDSKHNEKRKNVEFMANKSSSLLPDEHISINMGRSCVLRWPNSEERDNTQVNITEDITLTESNSLILNHGSHGSLKPCPEVRVSYTGKIFLLSFINLFKLMYFRGRERLFEC